MKVSAMHLRRRTTNEVPRNVISFAHAQTWQITIHVTVDASHLVTSLESCIALKIKEKNIIKLQREINSFRVCLFP